MNFLLDPCTELTDSDSFCFPVFEDGRRRLVIWKAFLQSAALVVGLLCGRLHNNRYVAESIMSHSAGVLWQEENQTQSNAT